jgi:hypothetical protein
MLITTGIIEVQSCTTTKPLNQNRMKKSDEKRLQSAIQDILWMAARYAHGRHTYAPSMVRDSVEVFRDVFPDFKIKQDHVIEPPSEDMVGGSSFRSDYLDDIFNNKA